MTTTHLLSRLFAVCLFCSLQSLSDIAKEEAERRQSIDQQGIGAKVIEGDLSGAALNGSVSVTTSAPPSVSGKQQKDRGSSTERTSVRKYRGALQKLDRLIRQTEGRLELRRARLQSARWEVLKGGKMSGRKNEQNSASKLQAEIEELEIKLNELQQERNEVFQAGKKEGYIPGDLDGKGIIP